MDAYCSRLGLQAGCFGLSWEETQRIHDGLISCQDALQNTMVLKSGYQDFTLPAKKSGLSLFHSLDSHESPIQFNHHFGASIS